MRKIIFFTLLIFVLAACNAQTGTSNDENEVDLDDEQVEETTESDESELEEDAETEDDESEEALSTDENSTQSDEADSKASNDLNARSNESSESSNQNNNGNGNNGTESQHQEIIDLAYQIFDAQKDKDYNFLEANISKGTKMDKNNNTFSFENVTYPHEQPFLTKEDLGEVEFRFTHEKSKDAVIVGFGLMNYEEEMSFVVEFEFVNENGSWKMNDMDLNK